jgi:hypothetical protein
LSVAAVQLSATCEPPLALSADGAVGAIVSPVTVALAWFDAAPTFPAASSAVTT